MILKIFLPPRNDAVLHFNAQNVRINSILLKYINTIYILITTVI